jgi:hypothetical protein
MTQEEPREKTTIYNPPKTNKALFKKKKVLNFKTSPSCNPQSKNKKQIE